MKVILILCFSIPHSGGILYYKNVCEIDTGLYYCIVLLLLLLLHTLLHSYSNLRQWRQLTKPLRLVVSLVRFVVGRRTGSWRKALAPVGLTKRLVVHLAGRTPTVLFSSCHCPCRPLSGRWILFRALSGVLRPANAKWMRRLDDSSITPVTAAAALGRKCRTNEAAHMVP